MRIRNSALHNSLIVGISVLDPYSLNLDPDPAKNLHPDPDPSYFFTLSEKKLKFRYGIIIGFYHQKKSIKR